MLSTAPASPPDPIPLAVALLDQVTPISPAIADSTGSGTLQADPRYLIGRLQQVLTALLATDLPPMDPQTALLSQALADAIAWRQHHDRPCPGCTESLCLSCTSDWDQADRYHGLARALGATANLPTSDRPG
jgi:hypothetical protein